MENNREIEKIEYIVRKLERGIKVAHRGRITIEETNVDYDSMIEQYVEDIRKLRDRLEELTGRRQPKIPKWPI